MINKSSRISWIDSEKGFILFLVCMYHLQLFSFLGSCRMSIFFFISGMLFSIKRYPSFGSFVKRKWYSLLKPYFHLSFILLICSPKLYDSSIQFIGSEHLSSILNTLCINESIKTILLKFFSFTIDIIQGHSTPTTIGLWFVYSLFQICCCFYFIYKWSNNTCYPKTCIAIVGIICFFTGWIMSKYNIVLPFKVSTMITGLAFYALGFLSKRLFLNTNQTISLKQSLLIVLLLLFPFYYGNMLVNGHVGYIHNELSESFIGYLLSSLCGTWLVSFVFYILGQHLNIILKSIIKYADLLFRFVANNGLIILAIHMWAISWYYYLFTGYTNNFWYRIILLLWVIIITGISIPIFNHYLYWMIGKGKSK